MTRPNLAQPMTRATKTRIPSIVAHLTRSQRTNLVKVNLKMHTYFLGLSLVGYDSLWGRMIRSGVAREVGMVKQTGIFPNGDMLRTNFTGLQIFDKLLVPAVIFYNNILSNGLRSDRMLLVSLFTTMQTMSHCMLVLGWSGGKRRPWTNM